MKPAVPLGILMWAFPVHALTLVVPDSFPTIQSAIESATHGDEIVVLPGNYNEAVRFNGKNIRLRSTDPNDWNVVARTILDGTGPSVGVVVTFDGSETEDCLLEGFTITRGYATSGFMGSWYNGGGVNGGNPNRPGARATVRRNRIVSNSNGWGAGIYNCDGLIEGNVISNNSSWFGAGLALCDGTIRGNLIIGNRAYGQLAHAAYPGQGGGLARCQARLVGNTIALNSAWHPMGFFPPTRLGIWGAVWDCGPMENCIVWGNVSSSGPDVLTDFPAVNSCIQGAAGELLANNIGVDPLFVLPEGGDFRLQPESPCIDSGGAVEASFDLDGRKRPIDIPGVGMDGLGGHDMGAYEYLDERVEGSPVDLDGNGKVNLADLHILLTDWSPATR